MEPGFNFELPARLKVRLKDQFDIRSTGRGIIEIEGGDMDVDVLAFKGDPGEDGQPGPPARYMGEVANTAALPSPSSLGPADLGKWWSVVDSTDAWFYNGTGQLARKTGYIQKGDVGPAPVLLPGTITEGEAWGFSVDQVDSKTYRVNIVAKPGPKGDDSTVPGPQATLIGASDAEGLAEAEVGEVLYKSAPDRIGAKKLAVSPGSYRKAGTDADWLTIDSGPNWTGSTQQITTMTVPPQPFPWEPEVTAMCDVMSIGAAGQRFDVEVRLGSQTGPLLARGAGQATVDTQGVWSTRTAIPATEVTAAPGGGAVVPAATTATIFVLARRIEGGTAPCRLYTRKDRAFLRVKPVPVAE